MDERKNEPPTGSDQGSEINHWHQLAESLGATIPAEEAPAPPAPPPAAAEPAGKKKSHRDRTPKARPPRSHWRSLANILGIGGANEPEDTADDETAIEPEAHVEVPAPAPSQFGSAVRPSRPSSQERVDALESLPATQSRLSSEPAAVADRHAAEETVGENALERGHETQAPNSSTEHLAALGLEFDPDEDDISRSKAQSVLESLFQPSPTPFWEEVGSEKDDQQDVDAVRFERQEDVEFVDEETPLQTESVELENRTAERPERTGRSRRGRSRRRRRGRPREESSADVLDASFVDEPASPSDSMLRLEASAELFDKTDEDDDDEFEQTPEYDLIGNKDDDEPSDRNREKKRITSWEEAISVIVERNLQNRPPSNNPSGGPARPSRGRRR